MNPRLLLFLEVTATVLVLVGCDADLPTWILAALVLVVFATWRR